jgi:hypothetical protein
MPLLPYKGMGFRMENSTLRTTYLGTVVMSSQTARIRASPAVLALSSPGEKASQKSVKSRSQQVLKQRSRTLHRTRFLAAESLLVYLTKASD